MTIFTVPDVGGSAGPPGPTGPAGGTDARYYLRYTYSNGVGPGGVQFLRLGQNVFASQDGDLLTADGSIRGISFSTDALDAARAYEVNVLTDPSGTGGTGPTTVASLAIPVSTQRARRRDLNVPVSGLLDLGVEVRRTAGAGGSSFVEIVVLVEVSIP